MSKHYFKKENAEDTLQVEMGWDKPTQSFYCVIWRFIDEERDTLSTWEDPVYSNLNEPPKSLEDYVEVCNSHDLDIPAEMVTAILADKARNAVNEETRWN